MTNKYSVDKNFMHTYDKHMHMARIVASCAKVYIIENYKKITDWSKLSVLIRDNSKKHTYYCSRQVNFFKLKNNRFNPVKTIEDVVMDDIDGDFSLIINGKAHNWIDNESIVTIAHYIEKQLKIIEDGKK